MEAGTRWGHMGLAGPGTGGCLGVWFAVGAGERGIPAVGALGEVGGGGGLGSRLAGPVAAAARPRVARASVSLSAVGWSGREECECHIQD